MKAKQFKEVNAVYGENQPEYYPLPAYKSEDGTAVFCFELDEEERKKIDGNRGTLGSPSNI